MDDATSTPPTIAATSTSLCGILCNLTPAAPLNLERSLQDDTAWSTAAPRLDGLERLVFVVDLRSPGAHSGTAAGHPLMRIKRAFPEAHCIGVSGGAPPTTPEEAIAGRLCDTVVGVRDAPAAVDALQSLPAEPPRQHGRSIDGVIARSGLMIELMERLRKVSAGRSSVLLNGATGSGKELMAQAIHRASARAGEPFVAMNCAALPADLLEAELFGYVKGAFSGAQSPSEGLLRRAGGGTLFLDEIGELPLALQPKLLRAVESGEVRPVGSTQVARVDVRLVTATHRDLDLMCEQGRFRRDLLFRISGVRVTVPTLDERTDDIPVLVWHFLSQRALAEKRLIGVSRAALSLLCGSRWPGNVRQLKNVTDACVSLSNDGYVGTGAVKQALHLHLWSTMTIDKSRLSFMREYSSVLLHATQGDVSHASRIAGRPRTDMYRLFRDCGLRIDGFRARE